MRCGLCNVSKAAWRTLQGYCKRAGKLPPQCILPLRQGGRAGFQELCRVCLLVIWHNLLQTLQCCRSIAVRHHTRLRLCQLRCNTAPGCACLCGRAPSWQTRSARIAIGRLWSTRLIPVHQGMTLPGHIYSYLLRHVLDGGVSLHAEKSLLPVNPHTVSTAGYCPQRCSRLVQLKSG